MIERHYFEYYEGVHAELTQKYDWFVRYNNDHFAGEEFVYPYYANGILGDVIKDAINNAKEIAFEIVNNIWTRNPTSAMPAQFNVLVIDDVVTIGKSYLDSRLEDCGFATQFDKWVRRRYWNHKTQSSVLWSPQDEYLTLRVPKKDRGEIRYVNGVFKYHSGSGLHSNGTTVELGEKLPYDLKRDVVVSLINEMRNKKWNESHEDIVECLMEICDVHETEVKEK